MTFELNFSDRSERIEADLAGWIIALITMAVASGIGLIVDFTSSRIAQDTLEFCLEQDPPPTSAYIITDSSKSWKKWFTTYEVVCNWD